MLGLLTKKRTQIPLFWVDFSERHYKEFGKEKSCTARIHPLLKDDEYIKESLNQLIDYIRDRYNVEEL